MKNKKNLFSESIHIMITPWDKGFTCSIALDSRNKMSQEQHELCSTIARGMIKQAMTDPHNTFLAGMRGFAEDRKYKNTNVIDFLSHAKKKRFSQ